MKIKLAKTEIIHFVGIGGIGMSGLALIMKSLGFKIKGSDIVNNKNVERLKKNKIKIAIGHKKKNINKSTIVVISSAIKKNNPEYKEAIKKKIPIYKRGDVLGHIVSLMNNIVIAGSHGKTTTTSLISSIFTSSKLDPTIINGGIINSLGSSAKLGKGDWCILETDESDGSFLKIPKTYSIVTNIDEEHMDYYKNLNNLKKKFTLFIDKTPSFGKSFLCIDNTNIKNIIKKINHKNFLTYGEDKSSNYRIYNIRQNINNSTFNIRISLPGQKTKTIKNIKIPIIGVHNIKNATASFAVTNTIGISNVMIKKGLKEFKGVQRRFNKLFTFQKSIFFDDYAHHPTEIEEVLNGVKNVYKEKEIVCVFQPHRISRLKSLRKKFAKAFKKADTVLLCPIYKAGENISLGFSYTKFANELISKSNVKLILIKNQYELSKFIKHNIYGPKIVIGMGAGSISSWMRSLPKFLK
tara:strand:+ start:59 stop:1456 length:1398 start_codon:yes stop_codon:yes gene_type:complete